MRLSILLFALVAQLTGCSKVLDNSEPATFPEADIQAAEAVFCDQGSKLKEVPVSGAFMDMAVDVKVFGFSSGTGRCALEKDVHYNDLGLAWLDLVGVNGCIPNGSLWEVIGTDTVTPNHTIDLKVFRGTRVIRPVGALDMGAATVRDLTGLRPLKCIQE